MLSEFLTQRKIKHNVLNARHHDSEAFIVAQAGRLGAVTIATNKAGRGTDIQLGGNAEMRILAETQGMDGEVKEKMVAQIRAEVAAGKERRRPAAALSG